MTILETINLQHGSVNVGDLPGMGEPLHEHEEVGAQWPPRTRETVSATR